MLAGYQNWHYALEHRSIGAMALDLLSSVELTAQQPEFQLAIGAL